MPTTIARLMRRRSDRAAGDAYDQLARHHPTLVLVIDACFSLCSAIGHAYRVRRTRRILEAFERERLDDIGFSHADLRNGRFGHALKTRIAAERPHGAWSRAWSWLLKADRCRKALAGISEDELCNLSEQGLKARREAQRMGGQG